jgi:FkbM family methyltransferase
LKGGLRLVVPHDDLVARKIYLGIHEPATTDFLVRYLRRGDTFLDLGAHVGYFTLLAAFLVGPEGRVHAFEPSPTSSAYLQKNVDLNGLRNVTTHCVAISDRAEQRNLCVATDGHSAWNSLAPELPAIPHVKREVRCTTLDACVRDCLGGASITLIKVDVEGWECCVLRGGQDVLAAAAAPPLLIEFSTVIAQRAGHTVEELRGLLVGLGYTLYRYEAPKDRTRAGRVLIPDAGTAARYETNLVAMKNGSGLAPSALGMARS